MIKKILLFQARKHHMFLKLLTILLFFIDHYSDVKMSTMASQITEVSIFFIPGHCEGESTGGFPSQRASNAEDVSIGWRHHEWT